MKPVKNEREMQGEGNYTAARRHRKSAEKFARQGHVDQAARDAQPRDEREAEALREAEQQGLDRARE